jgi:hypothetical protein
MPGSLASLRLLNRRIDDPRSPPKVAQVFSVAAVVGSLGFVGYEIRENSVAVRGATYQAISEANVASAQWIASDERIGGLIVRLFDGEGPDDFSAEENIALSGLYYASIRRTQNVYLQWSEGLISEQAYQHLRAPRKSSIFLAPYFEAVWPEYQANLPPDFIEYFEGEWLN